jgi:hypothetical protein
MRFTNKSIKQMKVNRVYKKLYEFYLAHCIDKSKNEIPLTYSEWKLNHGEEEQRKLILKQLNK